MNHFPVSSSNLSAKHLAQFVQEKYSIQSQVKCTILRAGLNDTYLIQNQTAKFIFRVYSLNWRTHEEIIEEIQLLNLLKEKNIPVSYPIPDAGDNYIQTFNAPEGERFGVMYSFAEGEKIMNYSEELHYKAGVLMAQFHAITNNLQIQRATYNADTLLVKSFDEISLFLSNQSEEWQSEEWKYLKSLQQKLIKDFQKINTDRLRHGTVHLDIWSDNFNVDKNQAITLFDFDFCGNGWLCLDIAYYMIQLYNMERYDIAVSTAKLEHFMTGYESITKLTDEEKRILPLLGTVLNFFYLGTQCQRFENWSNIFLHETYVKRFIYGVLKRYYDIHNLPEKLNHE